MAVHWSWLIVFGLVTWSLAAQLFPFAYPDLSGTAYWLMAGISALLFFACIALHELGHAFQAESEGMRIEDITLWLFGGVARFQGMFPSAAAEFRIAAAGPVVSIVLGAAFAALRLLLGSTPGTVELAGISDYLSKINLLLALFNLIPALPLDGGRILRAWIWKQSGSFYTATRLASGAGRGFGYALIAVGAFGLVFASALQGAWLLVLGTFLRQAALAELRNARLRHAFEGRSATDVMGTVDRDGYLALGSEGGSVTADRPALEVLDKVMGRSGPLAVVREGAVVGQVSRRNLTSFLEAAGAGLARRPRRFARSSLWLLLAIALPIAGSLYRPPVVVVSPGAVVDLADDVTITGVPVEKPSGSYLLVAVEITHPNALRAALSALNPEVELVSRSVYVPEGISEEEFVEAQLAVFEESRQAAAAAAAAAAGLDVQLSGRGALINQVLPGSPSDGKLQQGDVVTALDGENVSLAGDLADVTKNRPAGTEFDLTVRRDGRVVQMRLSSRDLGGFTSTSRGIGVIATTSELEVELPFEIEFVDRRIGGPSAGLVYGLVIADMLDERDLAASRRIAASGTIGLQGQVGPVGRLEQKEIAARKADASVLLVPRAEVFELSSDLQVLEVDSLEQAMETLAPAA